MQSQGKLLLNPFQDGKTETYTQALHFVIHTRIKVGMAQVIKRKESEVRNHCGTEQVRVADASNEKGAKDRRWGGKLRVSGRK